MPMCAKCGSASFRLQEIEPAGSGYKLNAVQCSNFNCQAPFGVTDYYNVGTLLKQQEKAIAQLDAKLDRMAHAINQIAHVLNSRAR
jgi:predicted nucleic-acid-binding Zn-ribbon protein